MDEGSMSESESNPPLTSYIGNAIGIAKALDSYGLDGAATLAEVGVDVNATPGFDARVPVNLLHAALMRHIPGGLDPLFGLKFSRFTNPITYHAFGVMLTSSTTLRAFCQRMQRYYAYVNTGDSIQFEDSGELLYSQVVPPEFVDESLEVLLHESAWAAIMLKLVRTVSRPDYAPRLVKMAFAAPEGYTEEFTAHFRCPIEYDAAQTALCFPEEDLDLPLPGGNAELARHSECLVYNYIKTFTKVDIVNAARMSLFELLPRGDFSLRSLSESLAMAEDDVSSQLKAGGISYQQLLGDTRRELAEEYIERADLSVNEIAYMLGFSDCSNFARSFRRWTGKSPSDFREDMHKR
jgi:AraC-like DNA-binding protein